MTLGEPNMRSIRFVICVLFLSYLMFQNTFGGTILSSRGAGTPILSLSTRSLGMGGISIALTDPYTISRINPAGLSAIKTVRLSLQYSYENNRYRDNTEKSATSYSSTFDGFHFVVPFGSGVGIAVGLMPLTCMDYELTFQEKLVGETYTKSVKGKGGLNTINLSFFWALRSNLALGFSGNYIYGKLKEEWKVEYDGEGFTPSSDVFSTKNWGYGVTAGLIYRPFESLQLGALFTPQVNLDNRTEIHYSFLEEDSTLRHDGSLTFPTSWGVGSVYRIGHVGLIGVEYYQRDWTVLAINDQKIQDTRKTHRISFGTELFGIRDLSAPYFKQIAYRFGFSYQPYFSLDPDGNTMTELWLTMGLGLPLRRNNSQIDVALSIGKRGSIDTNGLSENLFRISFSITGGEKWFIRRY